MARVKLDFGAEIDVLNKDELDRSMTAFEQREAERWRAIKGMDLPQTVRGTASGSALTLGETTGLVMGPRPGYVWSVRRLVVTGLTSGATPDQVNLYKGTAAGAIEWNFNGNNFGYTFGKGQITFRGGETFCLASVGTFNSTAEIILSGSIVEAPAELEAKVTR
jgi:hypothetical protein